MPCSITKSSFLLLPLLLSSAIPALAQDSIQYEVIFSVRDGNPDNLAPFEVESPANMAFGTYLLEELETIVKRAFRMTDCLTGMGSKSQEVMGQNSQVDPPSGRRLQSSRSSRIHTFLRCTHCVPGIRPRRPGLRGLQTGSSVTYSGDTAECSNLAREIFDGVKGVQAMLVPNINGVSIRIEEDEYIYQEPVGL